MITFFCHDMFISVMHYWGCSKPWETSGHTFSSCCIINERVLGLENKLECSLYLESSKCFTCQSCHTKFAVILDCPREFNRVLCYRQSPTKKIATSIMSKPSGKSLCRCKSMRCLYEGRYDNRPQGWEGVLTDGLGSWHDKHNLAISRSHWLRVNVSILTTVETAADQQFPIKMCHTSPTAPPCVAVTQYLCSVHSHHSANSFSWSLHATSFRRRSCMLW